MAYRVVFRPSASTALGKLPRDVQARLMQKCLSLQDDPRPHGVTKLQGGDNLYRVRVGAYRIVYAISDADALVTVAVVGDRKDVYR